MRLAVTTIVRGAPLETPSGWLRIIDFDDRLELARAPAPDALHRGADPNPLGGLRGARGMATCGDRLVVATNDRLLVLDPSWAVERVLSHRWLGGIHDLAADPGGVWIACADNDLVVRLGWDGRVLAHWHWRTDPAALRQLAMQRLPGFDRWADHRDPVGHGLRLDAAHVNAVTPDGDRLLVGLGLLRPQPPLRWPVLRERGLRLARRAHVGGVAGRAVRAWRATPLVRIGPYAPASAERPALHWRDDGAPVDWTCATFELRLDHRGVPRRPRLVARRQCGARPAHHALAAGELVVVAHSDLARIVGIDRRTGALRRSVELPGTFPFPRGLVRLPDGRLLVGTQEPAALTTVDLEAERIDDRFELPDDQGESPYGIAVVPDAFTDPVGRLPATRAGWPVTGADASA